MNSGTDFVALARYIHSSNLASTPEQLASILSAVANDHWTRALELIEGEILEHPKVSTSEAGGMVDRMIAHAPMIIGDSVTAISILRIHQGRSAIVQSALLSSLSQAVVQTV